MILYYAATATFSSLGLDHPMLLYGTSPSFIYSAMNGYGHFLARERWFELYWGGAALLLVMAALLFWVRGTDDGWRQRVRLARHALTAPVLAMLAARRADLRRRRRRAVLQPARGQRLQVGLSKRGRPRRLRTPVQKIRRAAAAARRRRQAQRRHHAGTARHARARPLPADQQERRAGRRHPHHAGHQRRHRRHRLRPAGPRRPARQPARPLQLPPGHSRWRRARRCRWTSSSTSRRRACSASARTRPSSATAPSSPTRCCRTSATSRSWS